MEMHTLEVIKYHGRGFGFGQGDETDRTIFRVPNYNNLCAYMMYDLFSHTLVLDAATVTDEDIKERSQENGFRILSSTKIPKEICEQLDKIRVLNEELDKIDRQSVCKHLRSYLKNVSVV